MAISADKALRRAEKKWSHQLLAAGWTIIPNILIEQQRALGLDSLDINILMHLALNWEKAAERPAPSKKSLGDAIGVDPRTIQRRIASLQARGLILREERREGPTGSRPNVYHFDGLLSAALPLAEARASELDLKQTLRQMDKQKSA
jgi:predicted transcriptional regulator